MSHFLFASLHTPLSLSLYDFFFSAGTAWFSLNLTCVGGEEGGREGEKHKHNARMNAEVHWQRQDWTQQAAAWGAGSLRPTSSLRPHILVA
jgi:hypothetical protein